MIITHTKVSGETNPVDPGIVGGEDWDDPHTISGPYIVAATEIALGTAGVITWQASDDFATLVTFAKTDVGEYSCDTLPVDLVGMVFATCTDESDVHYDVNTSISGGTVVISTQTRAGSVANVTDGTIRVYVVALGTV